MEKVYEAIAKQHGITAEEVRREMQIAIDEAYKDPNFYARCVDYKGEKSTPEEFIEYVARSVRAMDNSGG